MKCAAQAGNIVLWVILVVVFGAGLLAAGYYWGIQRTVKPTPVQPSRNASTSPSATIQADPTAGWKTYTNPDGFSFKYPPDWVVSGGQGWECDRYVVKDGYVTGESIPNTTCFHIEVRSPGDDGLSIVYGTRQLNTTFSEAPDSLGQTYEYTETQMIPFNGLTIPRDLVIATQIRGQPVNILAGARYNNGRPLWFGDLGFWFTFGSTAVGPFAREADIETADIILSTFTIPPSVVR